MRKYFCKDVLTQTDPMGSPGLLKPPRGPRCCSAGHTRRQILTKSFGAKLLKGCRVDLVTVLARCRAITSLGKLSARLYKLICHHILIGDAGRGAIGPWKDEKPAVYSVEFIAETDK